MSDMTMSGIHAALNGLASRQSAISDNISNVQTPGYKAKRISFEQSLDDALKGQSDTVETTTSVSPGYSRLDGNNVSLDTETMELMKTNLSYQTMVEAMSAKFRILRTSIGGA